MKNDSLKFNQDTHFEFGKNWADYSKNIGDTEINDARHELGRLLATESLQGKPFLDIGCGSGIHSLAALQMGAATVHAIDLDPDSVSTTRSVLETYWDKNNYQIEKMNIFDVNTDLFPKFDIVYSWGVLHHTGDMWGAIEKTASFIRPGGVLAIAIYRKTPLCGFWKKEKWLFTNGGPVVRSILTAAYMLLKILRDIIRLKNPLRKILHYREGTRGMRWKSDVIDWLGGYPYESAPLDEIRNSLEPLGFKLTQSFKTKAEWGVFGSGCAEYLFQRQDT